MHALCLASGEVRGGGNQPVPGDCLGFIGAGVASCKRVPCEYAKAVWECLHGLICGASLEIVPAQPVRAPSSFKPRRKPTRAFLRVRLPGNIRPRLRNTEMEIRFTISLRAFTCGRVTNHSGNPICRFVVLDFACRTLGIS
jgi:hypothetical protein